MSSDQGVARGLVWGIRRRKPPVTAPSDEWDEFVTYLESRRGTVVARLRSSAVRNIEKPRLVADLKVLNTELLVAMAHVSVGERIGR